MAGAIGTVTRMDAEALSREAREVEQIRLSVLRVRDQLVSVGRLRRGRVEFAISDALPADLEEHGDAIAAHVRDLDTWDAEDAAAVEALDQRAAFLAALADDLRRDARLKRDDE